MTVDKFQNQCHIGTYLWNGLPDTKPYHIGFWIFFEKDIDLDLNISSGMTKEIETFLFTTMQSLGYPKVAFEDNEMTYDKVFTMINGEKVRTPMTFKRKTSIAFCSDETVKRDYKGDYYLYTK